jgi:membrane-anchored glycerophosphoryl diester phosphodiesterase (GDPDase)
MLPWLVIVSVVSSVGGVAILRLWLAEESISVGEALTFALSLVPVIIVVYVLQGVAVGLAAMALLIPAFYVSGRLAPVLPLLAAGETRGPLNVLERAWAITKGNGWRIAAMLILVQIVLVLVSMLVEGAGGLLGARGTLGGAIGAAANAVVAAAMALVTYAVSASVYRQLSYGSAVRTFE